MNTSHNYTSNKSVTKCNPKAVDSGLTPPTIKGIGITQSSHVPFKPGFINVPVGLAIFGHDADHSGASQVDVLMSALKAYEEQVTAWQLEEDKENALGLIEELRESVLAAMYFRLSDSAQILHSHKYQLPNSSERSSK